MSNELKPSDPIEKNWGVTMHLAAFFGLLLPLGLVLGPLLVWLLKKNDSHFLDYQGKKAVNFQLTVLIIIFGLLLLSIIIRPIIAVAFMTGIGGLVFAAYAGFMIYSGKEFDYPFSFNFIKS